MNEPIWLVVDSPFNRAWNPELIGQLFVNPPSYVQVGRSAWVTLPEAALAAADTTKGE